MRIEYIYEEVKKLLNKEINIEYDLGRGKKEHFKAKIIKIYPHIFLVEAGSEIKSFSFQDIISKTIKIKY